MSILSLVWTPNWHAANACRMSMSLSVSTSLKWNLLHSQAVPFSAALFLSLSGESTSPFILQGIVGSRDMKMRISKSATSSNKHASSWS